MIKQSDLAMIILVSAISFIAAYYIGNSLINTSEARSTSVEVAVPISPNFPEPSPKIFNDAAINPTELIKIGDANKDKPFTDGQ
jgi:hypothetical protein